jgi:hypothetical protein
MILSCTRDLLASIMASSLSICLVAGGLLFVGIGCSDSTEQEAERGVARKQAKRAQGAPVTIQGHVYGEGRPGKTTQGRGVALPGAVVYLAATDHVKGVAPPWPVVVRAKDSRLVPPFSCVVVGQKLRVETADGKPHAFEIWSLKEPLPGRLVPSNPQGEEQVLKQPTDYAGIHCAVDPRIKGRVVVVPNTVFAWSDATGSYSLPGRLPVGTYEVRACHPEHRVASAVVRVQRDDEPLTVDLFLPIIPE